MQPEADYPLTLIAVQSSLQNFMYLQNHITDECYNSDVGRKNAAVHLYLPPIEFSPPLNSRNPRMSLCTCNWKVSGMVWPQIHVGFLNKCVLHFLLSAI